MKLGSLAVSVIIVNIDSVVVLFYRTLFCIVCLASIRYYAALQPYFLQTHTHFGLAGEALKALDRGVFDARYTQVGYESQQDRDNALAGWTVGVPHGHDNVVRVVCCPEDRTCSKVQHTRSDDLCSGCRIPVCNDCHGSLIKGKLPALALANDNFTDFMLDFIFKQKVCVWADCMRI